MNKAKKIAMVFIVGAFVFFSLSFYSFYQVNSQVIGSEGFIHNSYIDEYDISNVNIGDIIISTMTLPNYIAAMEKAKGFITDEGGITCHAAILSREFNVPCIVGTINATKVIKDNDLIELDANNGVVRILERNEK